MRVGTIRMNFTDAKRNTPFYRKLMEIIIGRELKKEEVVHHIDENPSNNSPNNLMVFPNSKEHTQYHYHKEREGLIKEGKYKYPNQLQAEKYQRSKHNISQKGILKRMQKDEGDHLCNECSRKFKNKKALANHLRWHKGFWRVK